METISSSQAIQSVIRGIKEEGLEGCPVIKRNLENEEMIHAMLIENIEDLKKSYYIVYWLINGHILCVAEVDAFSGSILSFTPFTHPGSEHYHNFMKAADIIHERFHEDDIVDSTLVWMPCEESSSSIYPFRRVRTTEHVYFLSLSGEIYKELTPVLGL